MAIVFTLCCKSKPGFPEQRQCKYMVKGGIIQIQFRFQYFWNNLFAFETQSWATQMINMSHISAEHDPKLFTTSRQRFFSAEPKHTISRRCIMCDMFKHSSDMPFKIKLNLVSNFALLKIVEIYSGLTQTDWKSRDNKWKCQGPLPQTAAPGSGPSTTMSSIVLHCFLGNVGTVSWFLFIAYKLK